MTKFTSKGLRHWSQFDFEGDTIMYVDDAHGSCAVCGDSCKFVSLSFQTWFCSEECNRKMWQEYFEALKRSATVWEQN
jgi:hypothetical protein